MHMMILVIGDHPERQMAALEKQGYCDWWTIGGRYSGCLPLKRGGKGKLYPRRAVPDFETALVGDGRVADLRFVRPSCEEEGADQATVADVDLEEVRAYAVLHDGVLHDNPFSPETRAFLMASAMGIPDHLLSVVQEKEQAEQADHEWCETVRRLLRDLPPNTTLTAVDAHN